MKLRKQMLSLALVLALVLGLCPGVVAASSGYLDVSENHWAYPYIQDVTERGIMNGVGSNLFQPDGTMTRAMFVTVLARMSGEPLYPDEPSVFPDVPTGKYFSGAVNWATERQIVTGYPDGTFGTEQPVTREQAATFLARFAGVMNLTLEAVQEPVAFTDRDAIHSYARGSVDACSQAGILAGYPDGRFQPRKAITRAEAAKVFSVFLQVTGIDVPDPTEPPVDPPTDPPVDPPTDPPVDPPTDPPVDPPTDPPKQVRITFVGEHGYAKYQGRKVTEIAVSTGEPYVEFGIYGEWNDGFELEDAIASTGKMSRAGEVFILSDFDEDVTVQYTTRYRTVQVHFSITPNYQNMYVDTPQALTWGQTAQQPETKRTGYHVDGWYVDPECTTVYDFSQPVKEDLTLYSQWILNTYEVVYMVDGEVYHRTQVDHNRYVTNPKNPEKDGFVFNGWFFDAACTQPFDRAKDKILEDTTLYAGWAEAKLEYVYLDGKAGSDSNSGMTTSDAVKTFEKAKELLAGAAHKEIRVIGMVTVGDTQVWDLSEYPDAVVLRDESYPDSYMFWINASGNLTLQNITVDGGAKYWADEEGNDFVSYMVLNCTSGYLTLNEGTEFCNTTTKNTSTGAIGYLNGAHLTIQEGVKIHDNVGGYAGAFGCTTSGTSEITMNGGEIYNNTATYKSTSATSSTAAGAFLLAGSSKGANTVMTMNGGRIYNNRVENPEATYGAGAIYMYNRANFIMNGGEITGNTGINAAAIMTYGAAPSATTVVNHIDLNGGTIHDNHRTAAGGDISLRLHSDLTVGKEGVLKGNIWLQNIATRRPIQVSCPLTEPLHLVCEAIVYQNALLEGKDYTLTEADMSQVTLSQDLPPQYQLTLDRERNQIYIGSTQVIGTCIYLSGEGNDANDGLTRETAVATFARAKQLLIANQSATGDQVIRVLAGTTSSKPKVMTIVQDETWSLAGIPNAYVQVDGSTKGYLAYVKGATLTLEDIVVDGNRYYNTTTGTTTLFRVELGDPEKGDGEGPSILNLKSGTVLQNCNDETVYVYGGTLNLYDGAKITGVAAKDGTIYSTGSYLASTGVDRTPVVNVYGGEIVNNEARCFDALGATKLNIYGGLFANNVLSTGGGAVIYTSSASAEIQIFGGTFQNNALLGTTATSAGTIFCTNQAVRPVILGGTFTGNTCALDPNRNGFASLGAVGRSMAPVIRTGENPLDLSHVPFFWAVADEAGCLHIDGALTSTVRVVYQETPASGTVVAMGAEHYTLTTSDLGKLVCLNEGITLSLDTANNQIVVGESQTNN